ncbi:hypothetical protein OR263_14730 [Streptomyces sp. NEAU-H22]|uniref:hypothetical protein n=1 Tax=Streptomyces sp. FXY-T5 TaxID=3064901 RepID=UPI0027D24F2E|nr:hypothetical protein [Streptomyces sp. FXY-T5]MCX3287944.1 hypothetical protein [Streptomyces sp. NEAU-H22]WMD06216.1 hypothetical protein Q7C01_18210 [Streptomyces sp. FXY-T5]
MTPGHGLDDQFVDLLDSTMVQSSPAAERLVAILEERGWRGWTRIERVPAERLDTGLPPSWRSPRTRSGRRGRPVVEQWRRGMGREPARVRAE